MENISNGEVPFYNSTLEEEESADEKNLPAAKSRRIERTYVTDEAIFNSFAEAADAIKLESTWSRIRKQVVTDGDFLSLLAGKDTLPGMRSWNVHFEWWLLNCSNSFSHRGAA